MFNVFSKDTIWSGQDLDPQISASDPETTTRQQRSRLYNPNSNKIL